MLHVSNNDDVDQIDKRCGESIKFLIFYRLYTEFSFAATLQALTEIVYLYIPYILLPPQPTNIKNLRSHPSRRWRAIIKARRDQGWGSCSIVSNARELLRTHLATLVLHRIFYSVLRGRPSQTREALTKTARTRPCICQRCESKEKFCSYQDSNRHDFTQSSRSEWLLHKLNHDFSQSSNARRPVPTFGSHSPRLLFFVLDLAVLIRYSRSKPAPIVRIRPGSERINAVSILALASDLNFLLFLSHLHYLLTFPELKVCGSSSSSNSNSNSNGQQRVE
jgi:hypothetical protein